jgi:serine/threonine protein kinase/formylglycine-generating enzyme required for sulfatase activity
MELMPGGSLTDLIRKGPLPFETITQLLDQIGSALDYAHREGVIHRDLKPQNVLLDKSNNAFLTDFGIAKLVSQTSALTHTNESVGTPAYMAPEQWLKSAVDARADLYSLGVMLFEMIGGQVPFQGDTPFRVMHQHANEPPPSVRTVRSDAPPALDQVVQKAMAKDPADRYESAAALTADVKVALAERAVNAPLIPNVPNTPTSVVMPGSHITAPTNTAIRSRPVRGMIGLVVGLAVIVAVLVGVGLALIGTRQPPVSTATPTTISTPTQPLIAKVPSDTPSSLPTTAVQVSSPVPTVQANTDTPSAVPTDLPSATTLPTATNTPSATPVLAPSLSIPELAGTVKAQGQTQTATLWTNTPIPTVTLMPNVTASIEAYLTESAATESAQIGLNQTAIATLWTLTWTPTLPPTETPTWTPTPTVATLTPSVTFTPSATSFPAVYTNSDWTPQIKSFKGVAMVLVPPGCFMMGSDNGRDNEKPASQVCFDKPFWIDEYPVTQGQFKQRGGQAAHSPKFVGDKQPMEQISWFEARSFCEANRGTRLPTEAEYEYAARGPDDLIFPWGNTFDPNNVVYSKNSNQRTADVDSKPGNVSWVGAIDMIGNVWEWTSSIYQPYPYNATDGRENPADTTSSRVFRGNSGSDLVQRAAVRIDSAPVNAGPFGGFRCARAWQP